jgi:hypothetical protein
VSKRNSALRACVRTVIDGNPAIDNDLVDSDRGSGWAGPIGNVLDSFVVEYDQIGTQSFANDPSVAQSPAGRTQGLPAPSRTRP